MPGDLSQTLCGILTKEESKKTETSVYIGIYIEDVQTQAKVDNKAVSDNLFYFIIFLKRKTKEKVSSCEGKQQQK